ncbi:NAD(P)-dependent oxidoreductase [Roseiarcaceae bacterium H3SJ34-1]|uniref:NAD(P)-dependent oxidoreductase n=1 Tax=Terripilifer ovatus TaxID=3032367 RepID=UPI003AB972AF|nr:NAD(P)-dependent oxidoreductase [Roseiarcaceae bacterium H3SJ34-1]
MTNIGWIGVGRIGAPMAQRLLRAGVSLAVYDVDDKTMMPLVQAGARPATSAADAAQNADAICLCVSDSEAVEEAAFGAVGAAHKMRAGSLLIDHSSTHPEVTRALAARAASLGIAWVDAPISGGPAAAVQGTLAVWLGGVPVAAERAQAIVRHYAKRMTYMGPSGAGQIAKSCNQAIVANTIAIWAEMLDYAIGCGLDPIAVIDSLQDSSADSTIRRTFAKDMVRGSFPELSTRNMTKDLKIIQDLARTNGVAVPHSETSLQRFIGGIDKRKQT